MKKIEYIFWIFCFNISLPALWFGLYATLSFSQETHPYFVNHVQCKVPGKVYATQMYLILTSFFVRNKLWMIKSGIRDFTVLVLPAPGTTTTTTTVLPPRGELPTSPKLFPSSSHYFFKQACLVTIFCINARISSWIACYLRCKFGDMCWQ